MAKKTSKKTENMKENIDSISADAVEAEDANTASRWR
jgi:hypothetical protein